jgi:hypothetical protein
MLTWGRPCLILLLLPRLLVLLPPFSPQGVKGAGGCAAAAVAAAAAAVDAAAAVAVSLLLAAAESPSPVSQQQATQHQWVVLTHS